MRITALAALLGVATANAADTLDKEMDLLEEDAGLDTMDLEGNLAELDTMDLEGKLAEQDEVDAQRMQDEDLTNLGQVATTMRFTNSLRFGIKVFWINFSGKETLYRTLRPGQTYVQHTYIGHKWVVRAAAGNRLLWRGAGSRAQVRFNLRMKNVRLNLA